METKVLKIEGMTCSHCQQAVTDALKELDGVDTVNVDLKEGTATVSYDIDKVSDQTMKEAVEEAGYEVVGG